MPGKNKTLKVVIIFAVLFMLCLPTITAWAQEKTQYLPQTGDTVYSGGGATLDCTNASQGYVMVSYSGTNHKVKLQISKSGGTTYTYDISKRGEFEVFALTEGSGTYSVKVYENISGTSYSCAFTQTLQINLENNSLPFLYPNQYVNFTYDGEVARISNEITKNLTTELEMVEAIYNYVATNITYDYDKAANVKSGYLPNLETTLSTKTGICFDYASLMTAMLRIQNVPARLEIGYVSGGLYHAWISVYVEDVGWINNLIYFDGTDWKLMDPTFASTGPTKFTGEGYGYSIKYVY